MYSKSVQANLDLSRVRRLVVLKPRERKTRQRHRGVENTAVHALERSSATRREVRMSVFFLAAAPTSHRSDSRPEEQELLTQPFNLEGTGLHPVERKKTPF